MFKLDGFGEEIFKLRYAMTENESWEEHCRRIAREIAKAEEGEERNKQEAEFYNILVKNYFMAGGRISSGAGKANASLLNCFVLPVEDSKESWGECLRNFVIVSCMGGGVGINLSPIRPRNELVGSTGGKATGAVSYGSMINAVGEELRGGGNRRVACMLALSATHPDLIEFMNKKLDLKQLNNANISIAFDDMEGFVNSVKEDKEWNLVWKGKVKNTIKAKELWDKILANALTCADPGVMNLGLMNRMNNVSYVAPIISTNPCQPDFAPVLTPEGIRTFKDIEVGSTIWSGTEWTKITKKVKTGNKDIFEYKTSMGRFIGTENHLILENGKKTKVSEAVEIDSCVGCSVDESFAISHQDVMDGLVVGDGMFHKASDNLMLLNIGQKDLDYFTS